MSDLVSRLFAVVDVLGSRGRTTTPELARHLGVSERTVRRDLARLQELDVAVEVTPGRSGGVSLAPGSLLSPLRFTDDELLALGLGVKLAARAGDAALERAAGRAFRRLEQVLTERTRARLGALRRVDPYGLARLYGYWYLVGYCHLRLALRTFRVDRVRSFRITLSAFVKPEDFDTYAQTVRSLNTPPPEKSVLCGVRLHPSMEEASCSLPTVDALLEPDAAGMLLSVRLHLDYLADIALKLLELPYAFEVLEPADLKRAFVRLGERAMALGRP